MAAWNCGWCGHFGSMTPVEDGKMIPLPSTSQLARKQGYISRVFTTMQCPTCESHSIAYVPVYEGTPGATSRLRDTGDFWRAHRPEEVYPRWVEGQDFDYVPDHIGKAASEAYKCHSIGAYIAAILMARTSIEAAAKDQGVKSGNLKAKIDKLAENGLIRGAIKDAAHQVRMFGNDMAHGDISETVSEEDSVQVLQLLTFILEDLYQVKSLMGKVGISLDARKSGGEE